MSNTVNTQKFYVVTEAGLTDLQPNQILTARDLAEAIATFGADQFAVEPQNPYTMIKSNTVTITEDGDHSATRSVKSSMMISEAYAYARNYYDTESIGSNIKLDFNTYVIAI